MLTKKDIINNLAAKTGLTKKSAESYLNAMIECFEDACVNDGGVQITGVVTIGTKINKSRTVINPKTKKPMQTAESKSLFIKTGKALKDKLNG